MRPPRLLPVVLMLLLAACGSGPGARMTVPSGASFRQVTDSLAAREVIASRTVFRVAARLLGIDRNIRPGVYEFPAGASPFEVARILGSGRPLQQKFTVPEGLSLAQLADLAEARLGVDRDSVLAAARDEGLVDSLRLDGPSLEGYLRPDTYFVPVGISAQQLVRVMAAAFVTRWDPTWDEGYRRLGLSRREAVTLASIVEGEARVDSERETIAGVYLNRLRKRMPLQADPTVQYALEQTTGARKPRLYQKDYLTPSPYNTYLHPGLPPGPVNAPSARSLEAVANPKEVPYLYFVADTTGHHVFAATYAEHLANIRRIRGGR